MGIASVVSGLDLGQATLSACLWITKEDGSTALEHRQYKTNHRELSFMRDWLIQSGCKTVGMEATGVYWKPVHHILEGSMKVIVGNPAHIKGLKGRKTDKIDAEWIARKVRDDEIIPSFIPPPNAREARDFYRLRCSISKQHKQIKQGILKELSSAGIPLGTVLTDVFGVSGMGILHALAKGETVWENLKGCVVGLARRKLEDIRLSLEVPLSASQRWALSFQMDRLAKVTQDMAVVDAEIDRCLESHETTRLALMTIPGVARDSAGFLLAELGTDLSDFPDAGHFAAWLGLAPGNNQTGGKSRPAPTRKGNRQLRTLFVECAQGACRTKGCWLQHKFLSMNRRMPYKKAVVVIAHKIALIVYHVIKEGVVYHDHLSDFVPSKCKQDALAKAIRLIQGKGGKVTLPDSFPEISIRAKGRPRKKSTDTPKANPPNV